MNDKDFDKKILSMEKEVEALKINQKKTSSAITVDRQSITIAPEFHLSTSQEYIYSYNKIRIRYLNNNIEFLALYLNPITPLSTKFDYSLSQTSQGTFELFSSDPTEIQKVKNGQTVLNTYELVVVCTSKILEIEFIDNN